MAIALKIFAWIAYGLGLLSGFFHRYDEAAYFMAMGCFLNLETRNV